MPGPSSVHLPRLSLAGACLSIRCQRLPRTNNNNEAGQFSATKRRGRPPSARQHADKIKALKASGMRPGDIAQKLELGVSSIYRILGGY